MQVELRLSAEDIKQARHRLLVGGVLQPRPGAFAQGGLIGGLCLMLFGGAVLLVPEIYGEATSSADRFNVVLVLIGALTAVLSLLWLWRADQAFGSVISGTASQTLRLDLVADGMTIEAIPESRTLAWNELKALEEDDRYVIFHQKTGGALALPKSALGSVESCREIVDGAQALIEQGRLAAAT